MLRRDLFGLPGLALGIAVPATLPGVIPGHTFNVADFGAVADGRTLTTRALQAAVLPVPARTAKD